MSAAFRTDPRILALWLPHLATDRIHRRRLGRSWRSAKLPHAPPLAVSRREANAQRIAALDERAEALRLRSGAGVAEARAMHPGLEIVEADAEADRRLLESLADWCDRYTPLVALDGDDGLFLDITGCAHLFGGEKALLDDILMRFFQQGFDARAGIAVTPGAAWAAARFGGGVVAPGGEAAAIASLPLGALRLGPATQAGLERVGLRDVGAVLAVPRAPLARRFGAGLARRLDQALGLLEEPISPRLPVAPLSVERQFGEPVMAIEEVERLVESLAAALARDLERRAEGARRLQLSLFRVDGAVSRIAVGASRPLRDPGRILRLFRERFAALEGTLDAGYGFDLVRLAALATEAFPAGQGDLEGAVKEAGEDVAQFADRVRARLGDGSVMKPVAVASHLPERAIALVPFEETRSRPPLVAGRAVPRERPLRLFADPEPIQVSAEVPEGPPLHFRWRRVLHRVAASEGPERIAPEWWREEEGADTRDYFRIEDGEGRRYWLYRKGLYGASPEMPRWFMHGVFA